MSDTGINYDKVADLSKKRKSIKMRLDPITAYLNSGAPENEVSIRMDFAINTEKVPQYFFKNTDNEDLTVKLLEAMEYILNKELDEVENSITSLFGGI